MKTEIVPPSDPAPDTFPALFQHTSGAIVLAISECECVTLHNSVNVGIGMRSMRGTSLVLDTRWKRLTSPVTITFTP